MGNMNISDESLGFPTSHASSQGSRSSASSSGATYSTGPPATRNNLSREERKYYYRGLPSCPPLVARTGTDRWNPAAMRNDVYLKTLRAVGYHPIVRIWESDVCAGIISVLRKYRTDWTSVDVVRIGQVDQHRYRTPLILWIGVRPRSLSSTDGYTVAMECLQVLHRHRMLDVQVEIRESLVIHSMKLVKPRSNHPAISDVVHPLTTALGTPISVSTDLNKEGSTGLFIGDKSNRRDLYLLTARHVVIHHDNRPFNHANTRFLIEVIQGGGPDMYLQRVRLIDEKMQELHANIGAYDAQREKASESNSYFDTHERTSEHEQKEQEMKKAIAAARQDIDALSQIASRRITTFPPAENRRILGRVALSPPIVFSDRSCTQDWALIKVDPGVIDASNWCGNVIDLGSNINSADLAYLKASRTDQSPPLELDYPRKRLLKISGDIIDFDKEIIPVDPEIVETKWKAVVVVKRGRSSGLTVGESNNLMSVTRRDDPEGGTEELVAKEWTILPFPRGSSKESVPFSEAGDSGSIIVDRSGRIGGLLTAGSGDQRKHDMTYATPIQDIVDGIQQWNTTKYGPTINPTLSPNPIF